MEVLDAGDFPYRPALGWRHLVVAGLLRHQQSLVATQAPPFCRQKVTGQGDVSRREKDFFGTTHLSIRFMKEPVATNDVWWSEKPIRSAQMSVNHAYRSDRGPSEISVWRNAGLIVALMAAFGISLGSLAGFGRHQDEQTQLISHVGSGSKTLQHSS